MFARGRELIRERFRRHEGRDAMVHARAAVDWLCAAQDSSEDGGVSHSYLIGSRWMRSYPETTGYIIPTLLNWSSFAGAPEAEERALRMADWELDIQLADGAIPDLVADRPVVFDAGQVLFGFVAASQHTGDERYEEGARRAAEWLLAALDPDGVWRQESDSGGPGRVYNARTAWAVLEYARMSGEARFADAATRFLDWTLAQELSEGWFDRNCLTDDTAPLLHTIAYTARGQLESGLLLQEQKYVDASRRTAARLAECVDGQGCMSGRFDRGFGPAVKWACLTGMAQMSIVWRRHAELDPDPRFVEAADRVNGFLRRKQDLGGNDRALRGGIRGSYPANGAYGKWRVLNWATKFFVDAHLAARDLSSIRYRG